MRCISMNNNIITNDIETELGTDVVDSEGEKEEKKDAVEIEVPPAKEAIAAMDFLSR